MPSEDVEMLSEDSWVVYSDGQHMMSVNQEGSKYFFECCDLPTSTVFLFRIPFVTSCKVFFDRQNDDGSVESIVMEGRDGACVNSGGQTDLLPDTALFNTRTLFGFTYIRGYTFTKMLCEVQFVHESDVLVQNYLQIVELLCGPRQQ